MAATKENEIRVGSGFHKIMTMHKGTMTPELEDSGAVENDSSGFRIHWYRCNVCGVDFEDANPSHRRRLNLLLDHKRSHTQQPVQN